MAKLSQLLREQKFALLALTYPSLCGVTRRRLLFLQQEHLSLSPCFAYIIYIYIYIDLSLSLLLLDGP